MSSTPPSEGPELGRRHAKSLVLVNTGDGKGKSTAAFGTIIRAIARGWRVAVVQFIKSGDWKVGEEKVLRSLGVEWWATGDGFSWDSEDMDESEAVARAGWTTARELVASGEFDVVLLDEITYPINWGWIREEDVIEAIEARPDHTSVIVTGRDAPSALIDAADTVTEMRNVKHAFDAGIPAKRGIDY